MDGGSGTHACGQNPDRELLLGLPEIDSQHGALIQQLDRLINATRTDSQDDSFLEVLSQLGRQIDAHFLSEESFLKICGMPPDEVAKHISAHEEILEQYTRLNLDLMIGEAIGQQSIVKLVRNWIVDHIVEYDFRIAEYVSQAQAAN